MHFNNEQRFHMLSYALAGTNFYIPVAPGVGFGVACDGTAAAAAGGGPVLGATAAGAVVEAGVGADAVAGELAEAACGGIEVHCKPSRMTG